MSQPGDYKVDEEQLQGLIFDCDGKFQGSFLLIVDLLWSVFSDNLRVLFVYTG